MSTPTFDIGDVATIVGVGCDYRIHRADDGTFTVTVSSGPVVGKIILTDATWLEAMAHVANEVESDLAVECSVKQTERLAVTRCK